MNLDAIANQARQQARYKAKDQLVSLLVECISAGYIEKNTPAQLAIDFEKILNVLDTELNLTNVISDDVLDVTTAVLSNRLMTTETTDPEDVAKSLAILIKSLGKDLAEFYKS